MLVLFFPKSIARFRFGKTNEFVAHTFASRFSELQHLAQAEEDHPRNAPHLHTQGECQHAGLQLHPVSLHAVFSADKLLPATVDPSANNAQDRLRIPAQLQHGSERLGRSEGRLQAGDLRQAQVALSSLLKMTHVERPQSYYRALCVIFKVTCTDTRCKISSYLHREQRATTVNFVA